MLAEAALLEVLQNGTIHAVGVDMFEVEPNSADKPSGPVRQRGGQPTQGRKR